MSFTPRSQSDIADDILAFAASDPEVLDGIVPDDLTVGSLERAHVESLALLLEESEHRTARAIVVAVSESTFNALGFPLRGATASIGSVLASRFLATASPVSIAQGTQILGPAGLVFYTTASGSIPANELTSAPIPIQCLTTGASGNVPAGSVNRLVSQIAGLDMVANSAATSGGADKETTDARAARFGSYLRTIVRGTNEALEFAALLSPSIIDARSIEPYRLSPVPSGVPFAGLVWLFVDDGADAALDPGVEAEIGKYVEGYVDSVSGLPVPGYKAAGTVVEIKKVPRVKVFVRGSIALRPGGVARWSDVQTALSAAANTYFDRLRIGEKASYQNLVTYLTTCDPDIAEVDLVFWKEGTAVPTYVAAISASDLVFYDSGDPDTSGARGYLFVGSSDAITYPEWRLA